LNLVLLSNAFCLDDIVAEDLTEANVQNLMSSCLFIEKELIEINKLIQNYNLIAPSMDRQFMPLRSDRELKRARDELIKEFPNSPFIIEARRKFERVGKHTNTEEPKGFLKNFINRFY
jgi:hypothetical protein